MGQATELIKPFSTDKVTVKGLFQGAGQTQRPWRDPEGSVEARASGGACSGRQTPTVRCGGQGPLSPSPG